MQRTATQLKSPHYCANFPCIIRMFRNLSCLPRMPIEAALGLTIIPIRAGFLLVRGPDRVRLVLRRVTIHALVTVRAKTGQKRFANLGPRIFVVAFVRRLGGGRVPVRASLASAGGAVGALRNLLLTLAPLRAGGDGERVAAAAADRVGEGLFHGGLRLVGLLAFSPKTYVRANAFALAPAVAHRRS